MKNYLFALLVLTMAAPAVAATHHCTLTRVNHGLRIDDKDVRTVLHQGLLKTHPDKSWSLRWDGAFTGADGKAYYYDADVLTFEEDEIRVTMGIGLANKARDGYQGKMPTLATEFTQPNFTVDLHYDNEALLDSNPIPQVPQAHIEVSCARQ